MKDAFETLNDSLSSYLTVHDVFLHQRLGDQVDYLFFANKLENAFETQKSVKTFFSNSSHVSAEERANILGYIDDLQASVDLLHTIICKLNEKTEKWSNYSFLEYRKDMKRYKQICNLHMRYADELNDIYDRYVRKSLG